MDSGEHCLSIESTRGAGAKPHAASLRINDRGVGNIEMRDWYLKVVDRLGPDRDEGAYSGPVR